MEPYSAGGVDGTIDDRVESRAVNTRAYSAAAL
jgi:hypothetical protein